MSDEERLSRLKRLQENLFVPIEDARKWRMDGSNDRARTIRESLKGPLFQLLEDLQDRSENALDEAEDIVRVLLQALDIRPEGKPENKASGDSDDTESFDSGLIRE